ncbi:PREDICTED: UV radiation resistance associated protein-like isoform X1 [Lupinus angustifolius]|uniref:UV radiation resistance associated protein-like isoform X1 n=1 Tax=Lupinus angustifolius TaxID=3871 RepID=UPI00092F054F|nr:PREDICTED: UV radiation resistance associated protein-like isoform X1 [Lupinus angustifolius]XP_019464647.1 PREDICTED: UV radiation resistance associated protein-like isoform X1 [Lupinus angustifolius]XP_019464648.1 PREDICTED: UV radiation resistance associated protein-like isoform X1 [Lupinus angustifolius]
MEPNHKNLSTDLQHIKLIQWEDFEHDLARLSSLSSALNESKNKKKILQDKLESLIQANSESLGRLNELEEMHQKLEMKKMMMESMAIRSRLVKEDVSKQEEQLSGAVQSLLVAGGALSVANKNLQESSRLLSEEEGYVRLRNLQKMLRVRQQYMASQISMLYPVKILVGPAQEQELEAYPAGSVAGTSAGLKPINQGSLTIQGLHLTMLSFRKVSFFTDKKEFQRSATALGYVAHAVSLMASYLQVPLRYPLRLGGSHSYIIDKAPSIESTSSDVSSSALSFTNAKHMEFPLFLEGQDTTRAAYAVFLLNKDLEQLLNFIGAKSLGPRHVLANLRELSRIIQSSAFIDNLI